MTDFIITVWGLQDQKYIFLDKFGSMPFGVELDITSSDGLRSRTFGRWRVLADWLASVEALTSAGRQWR